MMMIRRRRRRRRRSKRRSDQVKMKRNREMDSLVDKL